MNFLPYVSLLLAFSSWASALDGPSPERSVGNAALKYWPAFTYALSLPKATAAAVSAYNRRLSNDKDDLPEGYATAMLLLRQGAAIPDCRWEVSLEVDGGAAAILRVTQAREFAYYTRFVAYQLNLLGKREEAESDLLALIDLGRHFRNPEGSLIDYIVGYSIEAIGINGLAEIYPELNCQESSGLATRLESLRPGSPLAACLKSERRIMRWMILHANDPVVGIATEENLLPLLEDSPLTALALPKTELMKCEQQTSQDYEALGRLWSLPPSEYPAAAKIFGQRQLNPLSAVELPNADMVWRIDYHSRRGLELVVAVLMSSDPSTDAHLKGLGAVITPGTPLMVALSDPPDIKSPASRYPLSILFGRPTLTHK